MYNTFQQKGVTRARRDFGDNPGYVPAKFLKSETFTVIAVRVFFVFVAPV